MRKIKTRRQIHISDCLISNAKNKEQKTNPYLRLSLISNAKNKDHKTNPYLRFSPTSNTKNKNQKTK